MCTAALASLSAVEEFVMGTKSTVQAHTLKHQSGKLWLPADNVKDSCDQKRQVRLADDLHVNYDIFDTDNCADMHIMGMHAWLLVGQHCLAPTDIPCKYGALHYHNHRGAQYASAHVRRPIRDMQPVCSLLQGLSAPCRSCINI